MEVRNVQRTGKMHYVYLPTSWCKKYKVNSSTKIFIEEQTDGSLLVNPELKKKKQKTIDITLPSKYKDVLINIIMACYVNPSASFKIKMEKKIDLGSILNQKNIISTLEFVELDGENITYESSMSINEPDSLLKTMVKKIKNLFYVILENYDDSLVQKYEEEIDRSKILIQKSVISSLVQNEPTSLKAIDLLYTIHIATDLERIVDKVIQLDKKDADFLKEIGNVIDNLKDILENINKLNYIKGAEFTKKVLTLKLYENEINKLQIKRFFQSIAEIILDWSITKQIEN